MNALVSSKKSDGQAQTETIHPVGFGRMSLFLLTVWIVNVAFYFWHFAAFAVPDFQKWLGR
jgi:hypothetical protein